jgi:glycosyltransferase involved in cell wall biosynthesis
MVVADLHEIYPEAIKYYLSGVLGEAFCTIGRWEAKERYGFDHADVVITISQQAGRYYKRKYDHVPHVIRNTVDYHEFDRQVALYDEPVPDTPRILYAGGYNAKRGINILVSAMDIVAQETNAHLCLVGAMPKGLLGKLVKPSTLERIQFIGQVPAKRLPALIKTAMVTVHPILVDSPQTKFCCPHKVFEYMAAGKPIVASQCDSFEEYIAGTNCGVLVKPEKIERLAESIIHFVQHKDHADELGHNGRKAVEETYNWDVDGAKLCRLYEGLI